MAPMPRFLMPAECRRAGRLLQAYIDGELADTQVQTVADHLARCADCALDARLVVAVKQALAELAVPIDRAVIARLETYASTLVHGEPT